MDVIGRNGSLEAAYPPELLSIEAYTKGKIKPGDVLNAENVDIVKDLLDPGAYYQIKSDGRLVDIVLCPEREPGLTGATWVFIQKVGMD